jgi:hypothetical protein
VWRPARRAGLWALALTALPICCGLSFPARAHARTLFVRAGAAPGGDGSALRPFSSLAAVADASAPGDRIVVMPAPLGLPPLDGGIALKPNQSLIGGGPPVARAGALGAAPRITNSDSRRNFGDAIVLADGAEVRNLVITRSVRGGIYGHDVSGVRVLGNNLSATNTSCTAGLYVYFPGNQPLLANGWAAVMIDETRGTSWLSVDGNYIHDGTCADGIDIRASGSAEVQARVDENRLTRLAQGPGMRSVLAIGMQTRGRALLAVDSDDDSETRIGSRDADCEGLFGNQTGGSLTWSIEHNRFAHGIGGGSCNGAEFFTDTGATTTNLYIAHSTFAYDPGDMIEEDNAGGTGSVMNLTLVDVSVSHTAFPRPLAPEPRFTDIRYMDNLGRCMDQYSWGHRNVNNLRIFDSRFSDCDGDGVGSDVTGGIYHFTYSAGGREHSGAMNFGDGAGDAMSIDIEDSAIEDSRQYVLHFANHAAMADLHIRVRDSRLSGALGEAVIAFDQDGTTRHSRIDLGGASRRDEGRNCILGGAHLAAEATGYTVLARSNWWGKPGGGRAPRISASAGKIHIAPVSNSPPPSCALGR